MVYSTAELRLCYRISKKHVFSHDTSQMRDNFQYIYVVGMKHPTSVNVDRARSSVYGKGVQIYKGGHFVNSTSV